MDPQNYCPISLLPLLSKIIERIVHDQTEEFLSILTKKLVRFYQELMVSDNILVLRYWYFTVLLPRALPLYTIK